MLKNVMIEQLKNTDDKINDVNLLHHNHIRHKQKIYHKIKTIQPLVRPTSPLASPSVKISPYQTTAGFVLEYQDLLTKLDLQMPATTYFRHRPTPVGFINPQNSEQDFSATECPQLNPKLTQLSLHDYQKISLAQAGKNLALALISKQANQQPIKTLPIINKALHRINSLHVQNGIISYNVEEFNRLQSAILQNFHHLNPNFINQTKKFHSLHHDKTKPDLELSLYQRYCLIEPQGFIPTPGPDNMHDMHQKEQNCEEALACLERKHQAQIIKKSIQEFMQ